MKNTNGNTIKNFANAYRLAQMNGIELSMRDFKDFLGNAKELSFSEATLLIEDLYDYMDSHPIVDFQFMKFDVPWLTVLVDKLEEEIKEIGGDLFNQKKALVYWVDYVLFSYNMPAFSFNFNEAKAVYVEYKNGRASMGQNMAA